MSKGTESHGRKSGKRSHGSCRRCGKNAYHLSTKVCASCGYGKSRKLRSYVYHRAKD